MNRIAEKISSLMVRGYTLVFGILFLLYIAFSMLPPFLAHQEHDTAAKIGYTCYRYLCHQLPYRSFFLFGEQPYYPLEKSEIPGKTSFEAILAESNEPINDLRKFIGNEQMGYKMAICQRDTAIFLFMALYCFISYFRKNRIQPIPIIIWLIFGIVPMGLDGGTQLLSQIMPRWIPLRESTPLLRIITGALFGWFTCRYLMPQLETSLNDETLDLQEEQWS